MRYIACTETEFLDNIKKKKIIIFAASGAAKKIIWNYKLFNKIIFFVDNDSSKWNSTFSINGIEFPVYSPEILKKTDMKNYIIVIASTYGREIAEQLNSFEELNETEYYLPLYFIPERYNDVITDDYNNITIHEITETESIASASNPSNTLPIFFEHIMNHKKTFGCCGCAACQEICPTKCIKMKYDEEGFLYPVTNYSNCIGCQKCIKICPISNQLFESSNVTLTYAAYIEDNVILNNSSSGGIFTCLAQKFLSIDGIVYGAMQIEDKKEVTHVRINNIDDLGKICKSKYLQSDISSTFHAVKKDLDNGKKVLFSGTPCQIAAIKKFMQNDDKNLYTVDILCHGVPSYGVYEKFIKECEEYTNKKISKVIWRDKKMGWAPIFMTLQFSDSQELTLTSQENLYSRGFNDNLYLRPSCYNCIYNNLPRISDITLGDYWGYKGALSKDNRNRGISFVIISSAKGEWIFNEIMNYLKFENADLNHAYLRNCPIKSHSPYNYLRKNFFDDYKKGMSFDELSQKYYGITLSEMFSNFL